MARVPVKSSNILSVGFDSERGVLEVEFSSGKVYEYSGISAAEHFSQMTNPSIESVGRYFAKSVRGDNRLKVSQAGGDPVAQPAAPEEKQPEQMGLAPVGELGAPGELKKLF